MVIKYMLQLFFCYSAHKYAVEVKQGKVAAKLIIAPKMYSVIEGAITVKTC
jgi:hypothetical protein